MKYAAYFLWKPVFKLNDFGWCWFIAKGQLLAPHTMGCVWHNKRIHYHGLKGVLADPGWTTEVSWTFAFCVSAFEPLSFPTEHYHS